MKTTKHFNPRQNVRVVQDPPPGRDRTTAAAVGSVTEIHPLRGAETVEVGNRDDFSGKVEPGAVIGTIRQAIESLGPGSVAAASRGRSQRPLPQPGGRPKTRPNLP
jgi:hypothetical protein